MNLKPFREAELKPAEVAWLCGVSRVTAHKWMRKINPTSPHAMIRYKVEPVLTAVNRALQIGTLPYRGTDPQLEPTTGGYYVRADVLRIVGALLPS